MKLIKFSFGRVEAHIFFNKEDLSWKLVVVDCLQILTLCLIWSPPVTNVFDLDLYSQRQIPIQVVSALILVPLLMVKEICNGTA